MHWEAEVSARTYLVFGDIDGKLDELRVECTKCARQERCNLVCPDLPNVR